MYVCICIYEVYVGQKFQEKGIFKFTYRWAGWWGMGDWVDRWTFLLECMIYPKVQIDKRDTYRAYGINCAGRYSGDMEINNCQMPYSVAPLRVFLLTTEYTELRGKSFSFMAGQNQITYKSISTYKLWDLRRKLQKKIKRYPSLKAMV